MHYVRRKTKKYKNITVCDYTQRFAKHVNCLKRTVTSAKAASQMPS